MFLEGGIRMVRMDTPPLKEWPELLVLQLKVLGGRLKEGARVLTRYYGHPLFRKADLLLGWHYLRCNPFLISKRFLQEKGEENPYVYGETPLTTMAMILEECRLGPDEIFVDLGCGAGRSAFFVRTVWGCETVGIDQVPSFIEHAQAVVQQMKLSRLTFRCEDLTQSDLPGGAFYYFYNICMEGKELERMEQKLAALPLGTKVVTVSEPLPSACGYEVMKAFPALFTWGEATVYYQIKKIKHFKSKETPF